MSAHRGDDPVAHRQAEARPDADVLGGEERVEYPLEHGLGHPAAGVPDAYPHRAVRRGLVDVDGDRVRRGGTVGPATRSEEHTSELQSLMRISYAVFCLTKKNTNIPLKQHTIYILNNHRYD